MSCGLLQVLFALFLASMSDLKVRRFLTSSARSSSFCSASLTQLSVFFYHNSFKIFFLSTILAHWSKMLPSKSNIGFFFSFFCFWGEERGKKLQRYLTNFLLGFVAIVVHLLRTYFSGIMARFFAFHTKTVCLQGNPCLSNTLHEQFVS